MRIYVWYVPGVLALTASAIFLLLPSQPLIAGQGGLLDAIVRILAILPGFFIASLAAVATFQRPEMDEPMPKPTPTARFRFGSTYEDVTLTRRMFLSSLFSYLAILSLALAVFCLFANLIWENFGLLRELMDLDRGGILVLASKGLFLLFVFYAAASIFVTTLHGIYFLTERIHQPN